MSGFNIDNRVNEKKNKNEISYFQRSACLMKILKILIKYTLLLTIIFKVVTISDYIISIKFIKVETINK